jgi:hypothetical protein
MKFGGKYVMTLDGCFIRRVKRIPNYRNGL